MTQITWRQFFKKHGRGYLRWLQRDNRKIRLFGSLARGIEETLSNLLVTHEDAVQFVTSIPQIYHKCPDANFDSKWNAAAYLFVHMLERYSRAWDALETITKTWALPMSRTNMLALDVGSGPGPAAYAIDDFYNALHDFLRHIPFELVQSTPATVHCCERGQGMIGIMHHLSEICRRGGIFHTHYHDFQDIVGATSVRSRSFALADDDTSDDWIGAEDSGNPEFYRLVMMANFLTRSETLDALELALLGVLDRIRPGGLVVMINGDSKTHEQIGDRVASLAKQCGLHKVDDLPNVMDRQYNDYCAWRTKSLWIAVWSWLRHLGIDDEKWRASGVNSQIWNHQAQYKSSDSFRLWAFRKGKWPKGNNRAVQIVPHVP